jgi:undecaprenyl-diphosphatase
MGEPVRTVAVWVAQYLLWVMVAGFVLTWLLRERRRGKVVLGVCAVVGIALGLVLLLVAKDVHHDPRPFVDNPHIKPWFPHGADDGFPSDHSLVAALIAVLVLWRHRVTGAALCVAAAAIAWARVASHVHHLQDVLAGLALGGVAAVAASVVVPPLLARFGRGAGTPARE